jgi:hypothetical protein
VTASAGTPTLPAAEAFARECLATVCGAVEPESACAVARAIIGVVRFMTRSLGAAFWQGFFAARCVGRSPHSQLDRVGLCAPAHHRGARDGPAGILPAPLRTHIRFVNPFHCRDNNDWLRENPLPVTLIGGTLIVVGPGIIDDKINPILPGKIRFPNISISPITLIDVPGGIKISIGGSILIGVPVEGQPGQTHNEWRLNGDIRY